MRCPRAERYTPLPGSFGHHARRYYGRCVEVLSLDWDRQARVTPACAPASQEAWPGAERKGREPPGESRGGTPTGERVPLDARRTRGADGGSRVCRRSASLFFVARMERSVIRGQRFKLLDRSRIALRFIRATVFHKTRARIAPRERSALIRPRTQCGGGGPCEARWRGRAELRIFSDGRASSVAAPLPPPCGRAPPPQSRALRGRMKRAHVASQ